MHFREAVSVVRKLARACMRIQLLTPGTSDFNRHRGHSSTVIDAKQAGPTLRYSKYVAIVGQIHTGLGNQGTQPGGEHPWLTGCLEFIELGEKGFMVDIMGTVAGERHIDHAVDQVDRAVAKIDGLVCQTQPPEFSENTLDVLRLDQRGATCVVTLGEPVEKTVREHFFTDELFVAEGIARKPAGQLAG